MALPPSEVGSDSIMTVIHDPLHRYKVVVAD